MFREVKLQLERDSGIDVCFVWFDGGLQRQLDHSLLGFMYLLCDRNYTEDCHPWP